MHDHGSARGLPHHDGASRKLGAAFALNLAFTLVEIVGGLWTNSVAIIADAIHDLGDSFSLGLAWFLERYSQKSGNEVFSFGYRRFSLLGALLTAVVLLVGSLFILAETVPRLLNPEPANAYGMLGFAVLGVAVNGFAAYRLRGGKSMNERVVTLHLMEDVLGWVAVLVVSIVMMFWEVHVLDPLLAILITGFILWNVVKNLRETLVIFLQGVPATLDRAEIEAAIESLTDVTAVHHTHMWSQDGHHHVLTAHVVVEGTPSLSQMDELRLRIKRHLKTLGVDHATLEMETHSGECVDDALPGS